MGAGEYYLGWVRVMRAVRHEPWWRTPTVARLWMELALEAAWEPRVVAVRGGRVDLSVGQLLTSRHDLSALTGLSPQQVRTALAKLEAARSITREATKAGTLITVEHFEAMTGELPRLHQVDNQGSNQPTIRKKKAKEDQEVATPARPEPALPELAYRAADYLRNAIVEANPTHSLSRDKGHGAWTTARRQKWAQELDRMFRLDGQHEEQGQMVPGRPRLRFKQLVDWLFREDQVGMGEARFVVESAASLRKKWDKLDRAYERAQEEPREQGGRKWTTVS